MASRPSTGASELITDTVDVGLDFDSWYRREYRAVLALAVGLTGSLAAAEDIAHDGFADAHRRWNEIRGHPNPNGWIRPPNAGINICSSRTNRP